MDSANYGSPSVQGEEKSGSEESCCECCCEACRAADSPEHGTDRVQLPFTKLKDAPRQVLPLPVMQECPPTEPVPMLQTLSPAHPSESLTVAIEDLHVRQAQLRAKKQRRCAFCRIHGFPVSVKGHKAFCQFREKCTCKGCALIRCNQQVSKNQVRLRRQKEMEVDLEGLSAGLGKHDSFNMHDTSKKKPPMCFKCWVHDSVRVRLKGHRNICPYVRCACSNCTLSTDRKWLNRQLQELATPQKKEEADSPGVGSYWGSFADIHTPAVSQSPAVQQTVSANVMSNASAPTSSQSSHRELDVFPVRLHKAGDWQLNSMLSPAPPGIKQETGYLQNVLINVPPNPVRSGPVFQDASCVVPDIKWLPYSNNQLSLPSSLGPVSRSQEDISHGVTINNSNYNNTGGDTFRPPRPEESSSLFKW